jgi:AcrR family transcriptional regulator
MGAEPYGSLDGYREYLNTFGMRTAPTRADRRTRTRSELVAAADRRFTADGYHATSLDAVADEAGFTKGAVYSNFSSKEDLFFAVYERRVERSVEEMRTLIESAPTAIEGLERIGTATAERREAGNDGWLAVFFEFWAHVLRHPEHRARFAEQHDRVARELAGALDRSALERGVELPVPSMQLALSLLALSTGMGLERLTQPDVVGPELEGLLNRLFLRVMGGPDGSRV